MLIEETLLYLRGNVSADQFKSYKDLLPFLHALNPSGFEFSINQFISFNDTQVTIDNIAQFNNSLLELMMEEIENFGLYISDLQPVNDKVPFFGQLLRALYRIDQYEDLLSIKYILEAGHDAKETISEILVLIDNQLSVERIMEMTSDVSPALLTRIRDFIKDLDYNFDHSDIDSSPADVERIKVALGFYGIERAKRYFVEVGAANEPLGNYLDYFFSAPEKQSKEELAKLALFSGIAAGLKNEEIKFKVSEMLPFYFTDPSDLIQINRWMAKLHFPEVDHA